MECKCTHEDAIKRLTDVIFNGGNGVLAKVATIEERLARLDKIEKSIDTVAADIRVLLLFQAQSETVASEGKLRKNDRRWLVGTLIAALSIVVSILLSKFM